MVVRRLDTLLALKAVSLALGLKENDRRVAARLVEHFNRETTQCDPSLKRIGDLLGISTRTVIRSIKRLETAGLLRKVRHGGHLNRNHYEPVWSRFREIEAEWCARFARTARSAVTEVSPAKCQPCHIGGDNPVTQTCRSNLLKETCSKESSRKGLIEKAPYIIRCLRVRLLERSRPTLPARRQSDDGHRPCTTGLSICR